MCPKRTFSILVVVNKHNTARVASCWFIIYYRLFASFWSGKNIGRYKKYPLPFRVGNIDRHPTYKGGKVTEVVIYSNYIGLRRFYGYLFKIGRWSPYEGGQLDRFHCIYIYFNNKT